MYEDVEDGRIALKGGAEPRAGAVIETNPGSLRAVVCGDRKLADAPVVIRGDLRLGRQFFRLLAQPGVHLSGPGRDS